MNYFRGFKMVVMIIAVFITKIPYTIAESPPGMEKIQKIQQEKITQLNNLRPEEREVFKDRMSEALQFYYKDDFDRALPIFKNMAEIVETMDIMFWIGVSAAKTGKYELALEEFRKMLSIAPGLHRVRMELAETLIKAGRFEEARKEMEIIKAASPPGPVLKKINRRLAFIERRPRARKFTWNLLFSQGYQFDDNISSGPDISEIDVIGGTLILKETEGKYRGESWVTKFRGSALYDPGNPKGLMWDARLNFFNNQFFNESTDFNFRSIDISTGPWWAGSRQILKLPIGYTTIYYGDDRLYERFHFDPSYEHFFGTKYSIETSYSYIDENYFSLDPYDNKTHMVLIRPSLYLMKKRHIVSVNYIYENHDAEAEFASYKANNFGVSYFTSAIFNIDVSVSYIHSERNYETKPLLFSEDREDKRDIISVKIGYRFLKNMFASLDYTYMKNDSNAELYEFVKNIVTFNVGLVF